MGDGVASYAQELDTLVGGQLWDTALATGIKYFIELRYRYTIIMTQTTLPTSSTACTAFRKSLRPTTFPSCNGSSLCGIDIGLAAIPEM